MRARLDTPGQVEADRSYLYYYDGLQRLIKASLGRLSSSAATTLDTGGGAPVPFVSKWTLDNLGNWSGDAINGSYLQGDDVNNDGVPAPATLAATHHAVNSANEIVSVSSNGSATTFVHDPAGNLVFDGRKVCQYDAWNRLIEVNEVGDLTYTGTDPNNDDFDAATGKIYPHPAGDTIGPLLYRFTYDALGRLIVTERPLPQADDPPDPACQAEHYYYDGVRRLQEVIEQPRVPAVGEPVLVEAAAWTEREYVYGPDYVDAFVAQIDDPGAAGGGGGGGPQLMFTLQDANYNLVALVGKPAPGLPEQLLVQYTYEPYGTRAAMDVAAFGDPPAPAMTAANENLIGHQGLFFYRLSPGTGLSLDPATAGIYYNRNRWYEPQLGRFTSKDPNWTGLPFAARVGRRNGASSLQRPSLGILGQYADGLNVLIYQRANPINATDPEGLLSFGDALSAAKTGAQVYNAYSTAKSILGRIREFANGASFKSLLLEVALEVAMDKVSGKLLDSVVNFGATAANRIAQGYRKGWSKGTDAALKHSARNRPKQGHHMGTNKGKWAAGFDEIADKYGFDLDDAWNTRVMPHSGRHPDACHKWMYQQFKEADEYAKGNPDLFEAYLENIFDAVEQSPEMLTKGFWE